MCYLSCQRLEKVEGTVAPKLNGEAGASSMPTSSTLVDPTVKYRDNLRSWHTRETRMCICKARINFAKIYQ